MEQASSIRAVFKKNYLPLRDWSNQKKSIEKLDLKKYKNRKHHF